MGMGAREKEREKSGRRKGREERGKGSLFLSKEGMAKR